MGLGWKLWTRERLTADEMQGYIQDQVILQFASSSARDAALGVSPDDGFVVTLMDTGRTFLRKGGAWRAIGWQPRAHLYGTVVQSGLATGYQTINMGAALVDDLGALSAGAFICPAAYAGRWRVSGAVGIGAVGVGNASGITVGGRFIVNSVAQTAAPPTLMPVSSVNGVVVPLITTELVLAASDVVALQGYVNTGGWATLAGGAGAGASTSVMRLERIAT